MSAKEKDNFWNIDDLIPPKKRRFIAGNTDTDAVEVIVTAKESTSFESTSTIEIRPEVNINESLSGKLTVKPQREQKTAEPDEIYTLNNPFIRQVRIFRHRNFGYYKQFEEDGNRLLVKTHGECKRVPFFSYVPQYSQLTTEQLDFYLYLRTQIRLGVYPEADYSYLLLYVFELLNIEPDKKQAVVFLCRIWLHYRAKYSNLNILMIEWITDYCLLNHINPPLLPDELTKYVMDFATLKELFVNADYKKNDSLCRAMLEMCCNYNYKKSKFAVGENLPLYDKYVPEVLNTVLANFADNPNFFTGTGNINREMFGGALCLPNNKCRVEVDYCSFARSHELRFLVTDIVKHTENRIRAYIGVKSRLTIYSLPVEVRKCIDAYMDARIGTKKREKKREETHEYDKLYELPKREFSAENAQIIEQKSWNTTKILVEAFEEPEQTAEEMSLGGKTVDATDKENTLGYSEQQKSEDKTNDRILPNELSPEDEMLHELASYMDFIRGARSGDYEAQKRAADAMKKMLDTIADEINEIASDVFGDIVLEKNGRAYTVIEDYAEVFENA